MAAVSEIRVQASGTSTLSAEFRKAAGEVRQFGGDLDKLSQSQLAKTEASLRTLGLEGSNAFKKMRQGFQEAKLTEAMETLRRSSFATTEEVKRAADVYQQKLAAIRSGSAAATGGVSQLQGGLQSINAGLQSAAVNTGVFGQAIGALTSPLGLVALAFSAVAAAATLGVNAMVNNANEVRNLMAVSGLAAEEADNLADTFALLGKDGDTLRNALFKMGQELDSGGAGMEKLGISLRDTSGAIKTEGALLLEARDAISKMGSASERSAALTTLFGKAGRELADVFALSADKFQEYARQAGIISEWNGRLQSTTQDYILAQAKLRLELDALLQQIGQLIIPALTKFVGVVSQMIELARDPIKFTVTVAGIPEAYDALKRLGRAIDEEAARQLPGSLGDPIRRHLEATAPPVLGPPRPTEEELAAQRAPDTRILKGEIDMAKAIADGRLAILQAGLAKEQAARQLAVAQGRMTEQEALQASLAGISRLSSAQQAAYAANLATLDKKEQREAATAAHTAAMIGLETQRIGILTQLSKLQETATTGRLLENLANEQKAWDAITASMAPYNESLIAGGKVIASAYAELVKLEGGLNKSGTELAVFTAGMDLFGAKFSTANPLMVTQAERLNQLRETTRQYTTEIDRLIAAQTTEQKILDALQAGQVPYNATLTEAGKKIASLYAEQQKLAGTTGLTGEAALRAATAWELFGSKFDKTNPIMQTAVDRAVELRTSMDALARQDALTRGLADVAIQAQLLGSHFDRFGAAAVLAQSNFDQTLKSFNAGVATFEQLKVAADGALAAMANQSLYEGIKAGLLSITDTITTMVKAWIQGTLTWKSAGETLLGFLLNFGQTILHKVFDPILEGLAQVAAAWASSFLFGRGGGGLAASAGSALGGLFGGGGGSALAGDVAFASSAAGLGLGSGGGAGSGSVGSTLGGIGTALTSLYSVVAKVTGLPTLLDGVAAGLTSVGQALGLITPSVTSAAVDALIEGGFIVGAAGTAVAPAAGAGAGALGATGALTGGALAGAGAILALPALFGFLNDQGQADKAWRNEQRSRADAQFALDVQARRQAFTTGAAPLDSVRRDLGLMLAAAQDTFRGIGTDWKQVVMEQTGASAAEFEGGAGAEWAKAAEASNELLGRFIDLVSAQGITPQRGYDLGQGMKEGGFPASEEIIRAYVDFFSKMSDTMATPEAVQQSVDRMVFQLQAGAVNAIAGALGVAAQAIPDVTDATKEDLDAFLETMKSGLTDALVNEPTKILGLLDLSSLAQEGETLQETAQREATALATLGQRMDALAEATDALERNLTIPQQLAEDMGKVTAAMDAANVALATTQDPSKMLAAEQELERLIVERYNLQRAAEAELLAQVRQYASVVASSAQALAAAEPTLTALGISIQGMSADLATLVSGLDDASADLALLPAVIASAVAEASQSGGGLAGALDPVVSALEATFEDIAAILDPSERAAALQGLLAQIDSVYQQAVAGITAFYEEQRRQARALDELSQYEYAKQINALIAVQQEQEAAIAGFQAIVDRATDALNSMVGSMATAVHFAESLGIALDGVGRATADWVVGLHDATRELAALPGVIAAASGEARQAAARGPQGPGTTTAAVSAGLDVLLPPVVASFQAAADEIERITDPIARGAAWQNLIGQMDAFQSQSIAGIHSFYDAARSEAQSLADTALQGIRDAANARIEALRTAADAEIRGIRAATDLTVKGLDAQRDALNQQLAASREMERIAKGLRATIEKLSIGDLAPPDAQAQFAAAMSAFQGASPGDKGAAAETLLQTALSTGLYTRPAPEFRALSERVRAELADIAGVLEAQVTPEERMAASLESIDAQMAAARTAGDSQIAAVEAARDAKIAGVEAARAASEAALQEGLKLYLAQLSTDEQTQTGRIGGALYEVGVHALQGQAAATAAIEAMRTQAVADGATATALLAATNASIVSLVAPVSTLPDALKQIDGNEQAALATLNGTIYGVASATIAELQGISRDVSTQATDAKNQLAEVRGMRVDLGADFAALKGSIRDSLDSLVRSRLDALLQSSDPAATIANTLSPQLGYITSNTSAAAFNLAEIVRGSFRDTIQPRYPSYAGGIADTGPRSFLAILDPHERVLTAAQNRAYASRSPSGAGGAPGDVSVTFAPGSIVVNGVNDPEGIVRKIQGPLVRMVTRELRLKQDMYRAAQGRG